MSVQKATCDFCHLEKLTAEIACTGKRSCVNCAAIIFKTSPEKIKQAWLNADDKILEIGSKLLGTTNAGFRIIDVRISDYREIVVLAETIKNIDYSEIEKEYVTWLYNPEDKGFYFGHYTESKASAEEDFSNR